MARKPKDSPFVTRTVTLPIREVVSDSGMTVIDTFRPLWSMATRLANWAQRELALRDVRRTADMATLPAYDRGQMFGEVPRRQNRAERRRQMPDGSVRVVEARRVGDPQEGSLYRLFADSYPDRAEWDGATVSARDVLKEVEEDWIGHKAFGRFAVLWRGEARPCIFRFPYPWCVPADKGKTLRIMRAEQDRPFASIPCPGQSQDRVLIRLADGREFRRQLRQFDLLLADPGRLQQAKITGRRSGGRLVGADLRIVARFDRAEQVTGVTATVRTGPDALLTATAGDDDPFVLNWDHLRSLTVAHDRWAYRLRQDLKHEKRWPADKRRRTVNGPMVRARFDRQAGRLKSELQQAAACLAGYLARNGVADVEYDDSDRSFCRRADGRPGLNWTALRAAVSCACEDRGISLQVTAGGDDA